MNNKSLGNERFRGQKGKRGGERRLKGRRRERDRVTEKEGIYETIQREKERDSERERKRERGGNKMWSAEIGTTSRRKCRSIEQREEGDDEKVRKTKYTISINYNRSIVKIVKRI